MLLLVLILVLIAFGLLLVGFLQSSVMWAWVSVAVSVAAALVLLVDTLQRRSAVRAGDETGEDSAEGSEDGGPRPTDAPFVDVEPITEVIPVLWAGGPPPPAMALRRPPVRRPPVVEPRFDPDADSQQTVLMPVVQPSGSPAGPSGAISTITPSGGPESPTVITDLSGRSPTGPAAEPSAHPVDSATVVVSLDKESARAAEPATGNGSAGVFDREVGARDMGATATAPPLTPDRSAEPVGTGGPTGTAGTSVAADGAGEAPSVERGSVERGSVERGSVELGTGASEQAAGQPPPSDAPTGEGSPDEPPVEPHDAQAAALVADLEDEVVVIDEQPRYHMLGCRALAAVPIIPIPAREAVELGFTPCGWCSPDRTLAGRHPAAAHQ